MFADLRGGALDKKEEGGVLEGQRGGGWDPNADYEIEESQVAIYYCTDLILVCYFNNLQRYS